MGVAVLLSGCCLGGVSGNDCDVLVDKIIACDPTAGRDRAAIRLECLGASPRCVGLDTSSPEGCTAFMGCLYDG